MKDQEVNTRKYNILKPWLSLDKWQKDYINTEGDCFLLCGRQSGKSAAMSIKAGERAVKKPNRDILVVAFTEKQAYQLFFKILNYLRARYNGMILDGVDKPTKHEIKLNNGTVIRCYATGLTGDGLRTFTITDLFVDEAAVISREVFQSVSPMLSVTGGSMDLASTPRGEEGFFYEMSLEGSGFKKFYVNAEDCPRHSEEHLEKEKLRMSKLRYSQEYIAVFLSELKRVFSNDIIKKCCVLKRRDAVGFERDYSMGVDIARLGRDATTYQILDHTDIEHIKQVESIVTRKKLTTETEEEIIRLDKVYDFSKIYIDAGSGSLGVGVLDHLMKYDDTSRKVVAINNKQRPYDRDENSKTKIMKEDTYNNLVGMMERGEIQLLDDDEIIESLVSVQFEYVVKFGQPTKLRIFSPEHTNSDIVEGLVRAAWCKMDKVNKLWLHAQ